MTVQGPADRSGGAGLGPEAPLIWSEDALRPWLSQELAWTFPGASGFCKRPKRPQRPCLPPPTQLCQTQHAPTGSAHRAVVKTRLFSQPGGRVWRQGREVRWQRMPRYLCPQEVRRHPLTPAHLEGGTKAWVCPHSPAGLSEPHLGCPGTEANLGVAVWVVLGDGTPSVLQEPSWEIVQSMFQVCLSHGCVAQISLQESMLQGSQ